MTLSSINTVIRRLLTVVWLSLFTFTAQAGIDITYIHNDALGSAVAGTDEQGAVKWRSQYAPYGEERLGERSAFGVRSGYTGHREDPETGLTYMGARYYSPAIGRFMGVDPAGVDASDIYSFNRYAYANNNPYTYLDPNGESTQVLGLVAIGGLVFIPVCTASPDCSRGLARGAAALFKLFQNVFNGSEEASDGGFSEVEDITEPGARVPNIKTNVPKDEFEDNLVDSGFTKDTSKDGKVNIFTKGDKKFTTRDSSTSTGGPTADVFKNNEKKSKIRLGD